MNDEELTTLERVRRFLDDTEPVAFEIRGKDECALGPPTCSCELCRL